MNSKIVWEGAQVPSQKNFLSFLWSENGIFWHKMYVTSGFKPVNLANVLDILYLGACTCMPPSPLRHPLPCTLSAPPLAAPLELTMTCDLVILLVETARSSCEVSARNWTRRTWWEREAGSSYSDRYRCRWWSQRAVPSGRRASSDRRLRTGPCRRPRRRSTGAGRRPIAAAPPRRPTTTSRAAASPATSWRGTRGDRSRTRWTPARDALARTTVRRPRWELPVARCPSTLQTPACWCFTRTQTRLEVTARYTFKYHFVLEPILSVTVCSVKT